MDSQKVLTLLLHPIVFWATAHPPNNLVLDQISHFLIFPFSRPGIIIPTILLLLLLFLLLWVQAIHQLPHRIFSRPLPGSQRILLTSMVRVQRTHMHGWPWCVITLFLWLTPHNKKLHTSPHSYVIFHRNGGLVTCGGIMGSIPHDWDTIAGAILHRFGFELSCKNSISPIAIYHTKQLICV